MVAPSVSPAVLSYTPPDPPLKEFTPARDRAFFADPAKASLLADASAVEELTPHIGTELKGVQLSKLTETQKDELALLVAEVGMEPNPGLVLCSQTQRGVVFLRDQDITLEEQHSLASYYGIVRLI